MEGTWQPIVDVSGLRALARDSDDPSRIEVKLESGDRVLVPRTMVAGDGGAERRYQHTFAAVSERAAASEMVVPVVAETLDVRKRVVERERVRVQIESSTHEESVDVPLVDETLRVERVEVRRFVDQAESPRQEGDTTIVPVYEEVLVKRLLLREELHITKVRQERSERRTMPLRREQAEVQTTVLSASPTSSTR